jgi:ADP-heptose:LPS heptosyltransferase
MLGSKINDLHNRFYAWRQRRPMKRFLAIGALAIAWPSCYLLRRLQRLGSPDREMWRILVLHFGGLGDTLMLTPALRALNDRYPNAHIDFLTLHGYVKEAFAHHPRFSAITVLPVFPGHWIISRLAGRSGPRLIFATLRYYPDLLLKFAFARYDSAVNFGLSDFDRSLGNALLYCLGIPTRVGARGANGELLTHRAEIDCAGTHRVEAYLEFLKPLNISAVNHTYEFPVSPADSEAVTQVLDNEKIDVTRPLAVVHPGGKLHINSRRWPAEYFARVCSYLSSEGFEVLVTGDLNDENVCDEVVRGFGSHAKSIAGQFSFSETAALLNKCELVITNDTATLHLAEAVRVPRVVSIFGPTDPSLLAPQNERHFVFRSNLPCAPCMGGTIDANTERCWREVKEECLWQTKPEHVIAELRQLYGKRARVARA